MSLDKRVVTVPLVDGLSDNDDNFASDPPGWVDIAEVRWSRDKQIGKRNGVAVDVSHVTAPAGTAKAPNAIAELDGVPHLLTADGTLRRDPITHAWSFVNTAAPRPSRVVTDPLVRVNQTTNKSDVAVAGNIACAVWEVVAPTSAVPVVYYGFWDISGDVPRSLSPPTRIVGMTGNAPRVVALASRYFVMTWIEVPTGARHIYAAAYDTTAGTYTFGAPTVVDTIGVGGSNQYALGTSADLSSFALLSYLTGAASFVKKLDNTAAVTASIALAATSGAQHVIHNSTISKVVVIGSVGTITHCADTLAGVGTVVTPFVNPASGAYTGTFVRATIGLWNSSGQMLVVRSTAGPHGTALAGPMGLQIAVLSTAFAVVYDGASVIGGVALAGHCTPFITKTACSYFAVSHESAYFTADQDPTDSVPAVCAFRTAPVAFVVRALVDGSNLMQLATVARYGQDAIELFGNTLIGTAAIGAASSHLPHLAYDPSATDPRLVTAYPARLADFLGGGLGFHKRGIDLAQIWPHTTTPARNVNAQALRIIGAGHGTSCIDGLEHAEMTPPAAQWLEISGSDPASPGNSPIIHIDLTGAPWGGLGNPNPNKQWGFCVVWRYIDARGAIHRGPPSSVYYSLVAELNGGGGAAAKLVFEPWRPVGLLGDRGVTPEVEVYACPYDGNGDFRLLGIVTPVVDTTVDEGRVYVALTFGGTPLPYSVEVSGWDATDPRNAIPRSLYTTSFAGSELAATPSPALLSICSTQSRLWGLSGEDRLDVWYTKPIALGYAPEWSDTLRVRIPQDGGPSIAIAAIDDKVIVFKRTRVFLIEGDGGDSSGNNSSLRPPRLVSSDVGCDSVESVVEGPFGVIFHSERGFMLLGRDLTYNFVGAPVMDQLSTASPDGFARSVVSACIIPSETEVRFALKTARASNSGLGLVWNYRLNRWTRRGVSVLPIAFNANVGGVEWFDAFHTGNGSDIYYETPLLWTLAPFQMSMVSSWIKLNGLAGFGRLWRAVFLFRHYDAAEAATGIQISCSVDYSNTLDAARSWSPADVVALRDASGRVELSVKPVVQKCEAVRFTITETDDAKINAGRGFDLIGVTLEIGVKPGAYKRLGAAARK